MIGGCFTVGCLKIEESEGGYEWLCIHVFGEEMETEDTLGKDMISGCFTVECLKMKESVGGCFYRRMLKDEVVMYLHVSRGEERETEDALGKEMGSGCFTVECLKMKESVGGCFTVECLNNEDSVGEL